MSVTLKEIFSKEKSFNEDILSAAEHKNLVFFLGAGVSRLMGLPGWEEFSAQLIKKAFPDYSVHTPLLKEISNSKERITIAFKEFERLGRKEEFYACFGEAMKPKREFKAKKNIYRILNRFSALFLTTNADNLFEELLGTAVCHESCYLDGQTKEFLGKTNHLFYLHGHYAEYVLHTLEDVTTPTVGLLDIYLEATDKCQSFSAYSIKIEHIIGFFDVDTEKAHALTKFVVTKRLFWDEENLRTLFEKYKEKGLNRKGKEIVILLQEQGIISFDQKAEWGEFFNKNTSCS